MTTLTGIKNAEYLAQFLGGRIAIQGTHSTYGIFRLVSIHADKSVHVEDSQGTRYKFPWEQCENPYIILTNSNLRVEIKWQPNL